MLSWAIPVLVSATGAGVSGASVLLKCLGGCGSERLIFAGFGAVFFLDTVFHERGSSTVAFKKSFQWDIWNETDTLPLSQAAIYTKFDH
jgi:hypothetical protein